MKYIILNLLGYHILTFVIVMINYILKDKFKKNIQPINKKISFLIPARNEEKKIGNLINQLIKIKDLNIEIIIYNDLSTDNTKQIIEEFQKIDKRIKLIEGKELEKGWLGKNYACYNLAKKADGEIIIFLDADVNINIDYLNYIVNYFTKNKLALWSIFPTQIMKTIGEKLVVPIMNNILITFLPLIFVEKLKTPLFSAANGQILIFEKEIYNKLQPHSKFKDNKVEDIFIAKYYKSNKHLIKCSIDDNFISCRMYENFNDALNGFTKNIKEMMVNSYIIGFLFVLFNLLPFILIYKSKIILMIISIIYMKAIMISLISKQNIIINVIFFPLQQIIIFTLLIKRIINNMTGNLEWKGRKI